MAIGAIPPPHHAGAVFVRQAALVGAGNLSVRAVRSAARQRNPQRLIRILALAGCLLLSACATGPAPQRSVLARWTPSPNEGARRPELIVLHHTAIPDTVKSLAALRRKGNGGRVSAHYLIGPAGETLQLVDEGRRAWHAGVSRWGNVTDVNSASIGIELVNDGYSSYPPAQIQALIALLGDITQRLGIAKTSVVGHADIAPTRKIDPNIQFPWADLARYGFGRWYTLPLPQAPRGFDAMNALRLIGYDTQNPSAAIVAFRRHFRASESNALDAMDAAILASLLRGPGAAP